jgi:hypothetical protein
MPNVTRVIGLDETMKKLSPDLIASPARNFLNRWAIGTQTTARELVAVDRGLLRRDINVEVDSANPPRFARVGTNTEYGPDIEHGTNAHYVDPAVLEPWARRKGLGKGAGYAIAHSIARAGTKAQPFLQPAFDQNEGKIDGLMQRMAREIEAQGGKA